MDRVFMDLALEGIRAHPVKYLEISLRSALGLLYHGLTFSYGMMPITDVEGTAARAQFFREWYFNAHLRWEDMVVAPGFRPANRDSILILAPDALSRFIAIWFKALSTAVIALFGLTAWAFGLERSTRQELFLLAPLGVTVVLYLLLCGFVVVGEPPRFLEPIQDIIVAAILALFAFGWRSIQASLRCSE